MTTFQLALKAAKLTDAKFGQLIRETVDAGGWNAVRQNPVLCRLWELERKEAREYVNAVIDR